MAQFFLSQEVEPRLKAALLLAAVSVMLSGCISSADISNSDLVGTQWKLKAIVSMDDTQERLIPTGDQTFTIDFQADGRAYLQIDCNRGSATYSTSKTSPLGGRLEFGPVATTRAMCPRPQIGNFLISELLNVATYTIDGKRLSLAIKMDSGIFEFSASD